MMLKLTNKSHGRTYENVENLACYLNEANESKNQRLPDI